MVTASTKVNEDSEKKSTSAIVLKISGGILQLLINVAFYIAVVLLIIKAANFAYDFAYQVFGDVPYDAESTRQVEVQILKGESSINIATKLETNKLIVDKYSFYIKTKLKEYNIMPGTFILSPAMSYDEILAVITDYSQSIVQDEMTVEEQENAP